MEMMKPIVTMLLFTLVLPAVAGELSGRRAPSFALPDMQGKYHDVLDYRGRVLLIDVMQTGCPHCQTLAPTLEKVKAKYGAKVAVLSFVNPPDNPKTVADFIAKYKVTSPIVFDCGQASAIYMMATPQRPSITLPHLFIIDQQGTIREDYSHSDATKTIFEGDALFPVIDKLLAGAPAAKKK